MLVSSAPPVSVPTGLLPECIWLDIPFKCPARSAISTPPHGENEVGGAVSRSYRSLDGGRQPRISPVAGEKQVFVRRHRTRPQRVLFRRGLEGGAPLAHDLPGRQLAGNAAGLADIPPDRLGKFLT